MNSEHYFFISNIATLIQVLNNQSFGHLSISIKINFRSYCEDSRPSSAASGHVRPPQANVKRRVSRVESLRNLLFNRNGPHNHQVDPEKMLLKKRARSAEKDKATEKVSKL